MEHYNYFYLPNSLILNTQLRCSDFAVAAYLYSLYSAYGYDTLLGACVKVKQNTIAQACKISVDSVARACARLMKCGIIVGRERTIRSDRTLGTYTYTLQHFHSEEHKHTLVSKKAAAMLQPKELRVYALFCLCRENYKNSFFHSYNDLAELLKMRKDDIIAAVNKLVSAGLIRKQKRRTHCGDYTENKYFIIVHSKGRITGSRKRKTATVFHLGRCLLPKEVRPTSAFKSYLQANDNTVSLACQGVLKNFVGFFMVRGSPKFAES